MKREPIKIRIQNFQSIEDVSFVVDGFTCVTGPSNIGKSAIVRAVSGAFLNSPVTNLVRKGSKHCSVTIKTPSWGFLWEKGKGTNRYTIDGREDRPLDKVDRGQVDEIAALGFQAVDVGRVRMYPWYASQFRGSRDGAISGPLFLLDETGSAVTEFFSEVARLQVLQDAISASLSRKAKSHSEARSKEADLKGVTDSLSSLSDVSLLLPLESDLAGEEKSILEYEERMAKAERIATSADEASSAVFRLEPVTKIKISQAPDLTGLMNMHRRSEAMEAVAQRIIPLRGISAIPAFDPSTNEIVAQLRTAKKVASARDLASALEPVTALKAQTPLGEMKAFKKASGLLKALEREEEREQRLRDVQAVTFSNLEATDGTGKLKRLRRIAAEAEKASAAERDQSRLLRGLEEEESRLQAELSEIKTCLACGRPVS